MSIFWSVIEACFTKKQIVQLLTTEGATPAFTICSKEAVTIPDEEGRSGI